MRGRRKRRRKLFMLGNDFGNIFGLNEFVLKIYKE